MSIWNDMDKGAVKHEDAFEQADQAVKRKSAAAGDAMPRKNDAIGRRRFLKGAGAVSAALGASPATARTAPSS